MLDLTDRRVCKDLVVDQVYKLVNEFAVTVCERKVMVLGDLSVDCQNASATLLQQLDYDFNRIMLLYERLYLQNGAMVKLMYGRAKPNLRQLVLYRC